MRHSRTATGLIALATTIAGCGGGKDYANDPRPPIPVNISAAISDQQVTVSPKKVGAGPVVIIIANETRGAHRVTVETDVLGAAEGGIKQQTSPINPDGTATLKLDLRKGTYKVSVDDGDISAARLKIGEPRESSQDELLQP